MKILRIKFKNIHSLKGEFSIDFEHGPLSKTGIFAIVGPTGSGKSTILDVIMLALFGQMPRFNEKISKSSVEKFGTVLTRGTLESYAEIEYRTKGKSYRSNWSISVARTGNLRDYNMELAELPSEKLIDDYKSNVPKHNEEIIGLNYEQFLKSIILAQGDFSKFLKSKPEERTQMLEKITGTEIYRIIGAKAYEIAKDYKEKLEKKQTVLLNFELLSDEEIEESKLLIDEISKKNTDFKSRQNILKASFDIKKQKLDIGQNLNNLFNQKEINNKEIDDFRDSFEKLKLHQQLVILQTDLNEVKNLKLYIFNAKEKIFSGHNFIKEFEQKASTIESEISVNEEDLAELNKKKENTEPFFVQAKKLEQNIFLLTDQVKQKQKEFSNSSYQLNQLENKIKDLLDKNEQANIQILKSKNWLENNISLEDLNTDLIIITQALKNYDETKRIADNAINASNFNDVFLKGNWRNYKSLSDNLISKVNENILTLLDKVKDEFAEDDLNSRYDKVVKDTQIVEKLLELNSQKNELKEANKLLQKQQIENHKNKENIQSKLHTFENELIIVAKKIEEIEKRLERENLEAKYEQDRLHLVEDEPCPLCGSMHHPLRNYKKPLNIISTKNEIKNTKEIKSKLESDILSFSKQKVSIETTIINLDKNIEQNTYKLKQTEQEFDTLFEKLSEKPESKEKILLEGFYKELVVEKTEIKQQQNIKTKLQLLKEQKKELEHLSEKINSTFNLRHIYTEKLIRYKNYFEGAKSNEEIISKLQLKLSEYSKNKEQNAELKNSVLSNLQLINQLSTQKDDSQKQNKELKSELADLEVKNTEQKNVLNKLEKEKFESKNFNEFWNILIEKINELKENLSEQKSRLSGLRAQISEKKNALAELQKTYDDKSVEFETKNVLMNQKLEEIGLKSVEEALSKILSQENYNILTKKEKFLYDRKNILDENIKRLIKQLEELNESDKSEKTLEQIEQEINEVEQNIDDFNIKIGEIKNKLENDIHRRKKYSELNSEIEKLKKESERWNKLNNLIGDAQGKNFATIAQQFTLRHLINLANEHLEHFSGRYKLDKTAEAKNNLFVYDMYQGKSKRSVHTLSGGETFLVSLSLALALSDLASQKTRIESLFIDEGFGTLDENTLDNALVNLEKLHIDSERTIGLISHVADIKERINAKIVLEKDNSGFSKMRVDF